MFTKKYQPSVKANNALKEEIVNELKALIYRLEKGRFDDRLDKESVEAAVGEIKAAAEGLEYAIGTGEENIAAVYEDTKQQIEDFKKKTGQELTNRIESAADELVFTLTLWKDVLDGNTALDTAEDVKKAKVSGSRKKLNGRLAELGEIKDSFAVNAKRLDKDIVAEEADLKELEEQIVGENNERKINELYRKIKATKSKVDMLYVRRSNYAACYDLLDMIHANAREILNATDFAAEEIAKAKVLLNMGKLKQVVSEPDKAIAILKRMEKDLQAITAKTATIDEKVFNLDKGNVTVNEDALKYKEELMRKKREKENLSESIAADSAEPQTNETVKETK